MSKKNFDKIIADTQANFAQKEKEYRALLNHAPDPVVVGDAKGLITFVNSATEKVFGYSREELLEHPISMLMPQNFHDAHAKGLSEVAGGRASKLLGQTIEIVGLRRDGSEIPIELSLSSLGEGKAIKFMAIIRDISDRKKLELQALEAQKLKAISQMAAEVAHDFNNILSSVLGSAFILKGRLEADPANAQSLDLLKFIQESAERGTDIVQQLYDVAQNKAIPVESIDLAGAVTDALKIIQSSLPGTIKIVNEMSESSVWVKGDQTSVIRMVMNLAKNSVAAMPQGGFFRLNVDYESFDKEVAIVKSLRPGKYVRLVISDTGEGMAAEILEKIFTPFFTTKSKSKGTGLGLSATASKMKAFGGAIEVKSEVGKGSEFSLLFPAGKPVFDSIGQEA